MSPFHLLLFYPDHLLPVNSYLVLLLDDHIGPTHVVQPVDHHHSGPATAKHHVLHQLSLVGKPTMAASTEADKMLGTLFLIIYFALFLHMDHELLFTVSVQHLAQVAGEPLQVGWQLNEITVLHFLLQIRSVNSKLCHVADGLLHVVVVGVHGQVYKEDPVRMLCKVQKSLEDMKERKNLSCTVRRKGTFSSNNLLLGHHNYDLV